MSKRAECLLIIPMALVCLTVGSARAQELDEDRAIVAEELIVEEAVTGNLIEEDVLLAEDVVIDEPAADIEDVMIEVEDLVIEEPVAEVVIEEEKGVLLPEIAEEVVEVEAVEEMVEEVVADVPQSTDLDKIVANEMQDALSGGIPEPPPEMMAAVKAAEEVVVEEPAIEIEEPIVEAVEEVVVEEPMVEVVEEVVIEELAVDVIELEVPPVEAVVIDAVEEEPVATLEETMGALEEPVPMEEAPVEPVVEPVPVVMEAPVDPLVAELDEMVQREELRRRALEAHGLDSLKDGRKALRDGKYKESAGLFEEALRYILERPEMTKYRTQAREGLAESFYGWAQLLLEQNDHDAAQEMAHRAQAHGHPGASALITDIAKSKAGPPPVTEEAPDRRWKEKEYQQIEKALAGWLLRARQHILVGEYDLAKKELSSVMAVDPENTEAIRLLHKIALKRFDRSSMELEATRSDMMRDVRDTWNPRDYVVSIPQPGKGQGRADPSKLSGGRRSEIMEKMQKIIIPEIDFRQANIHDVIDFLQEQSVLADPEPDPTGRKGVNIILHIGETGGGQAPRASAADPFADAIEDVGLGAASEVPMITFTARYISLLEALKIVTKVADLKFRIEESVVMIVPLNAAESDIIVRTYNVLPTVEEKITTVGAEIGGGGGGGFGGDFQPMGAGGLGVEATNWKEFFSGMGVQWPENSSIKYVRSIGKLVVANTADNLTVFEQVLNELNVTPRQIEIEARFVEVEQTDLDSLGFEWMLNDQWEIATKAGQGGVMGAGRQRVVMDGNSAGGGFTRGLRFSDALPAGLGAVADDVMTVRSVLTNPELGLVMHLLEQKGNTDLLSSPKITTKSGQEAVIKVVTEYIYPTEFTVTPITATASGGSGTAQIVGGVVEPGGFETREVGVILSVLPEVSPEGQMINLTMTPEVVSEPEWHEYGSVYTDANGNEQRLNMQQPFFHTRTISTSISIYNNATVVMGGMITELRIDVDDKVPFLGDIPILGRLFRSRYDHSVKRNLLIFVTARLVDPSGRPLEEQRGPTISGIADRLGEAAQMEVDSE